MSAIAFDAHEIVKELTRAGFTETQAEAATSAVKKSQDADPRHLATKADPQISLEQTKVELLKWLIGLIGFQTVAVLGVVVALTQLGH